MRDRSALAFDREQQCSHQVKSSPDGQENGRRTDFTWYRGRLEQRTGDRAPGVRFVRSSSHAVPAESAFLNFKTLSNGDRTPLSRSATSKASPSAQRRSSKSTISRSFSKGSQPAPTSPEDDLQCPKIQAVSAKTTSSWCLDGAYSNAVKTPRSRRCSGCYG